MYPWDAVVDGSLAASEPDNRKFKGIGEALDWLSLNVPEMGSAASHCAVFVRSNDATGAKMEYIETANWNAPIHVLLFGGSVGHGSFPGTDGGGFDWRPGNFTPVVIPFYSRETVIYNCGNLNIAKTTATVAPWGMVSIVNSRLNSSNTSGQAIFQVFSASDSYIFNGMPDNLTSGRCVLDNCHVDMNTRTSTPCPTTSAFNYFQMTSCILTGAGTINLPQRFSIEVASGTGSGGLGTMGAFVLPNQAETRGYIRSTATFGASPTVTATGAFSSLILDGVFGTLTITGAHDNLEVRASQNPGVSNNWEFTGPAVLDLNLDSSLGSGAFAVKLNGTRVEASFAGRILSTGSGPGSMRTGIRCAGLTHSNIRAALNATGYVVGTLLQPYDFDAASTDNFLTLTGGATFPDAGTSASATNRIEEPPGSGVTGLAGSVVSETTFGQASAVGAATTSARGDHTHGTPTLDFGEDGDIAASNFGDAAAAGATGEVADAGHRHARETNPVTAHEAAADPHAGYQKESEKDANGGYVGRDGSGHASLSGQIRATGGLGVGNSAAATTPGTVVKKIEVFDASGVSLGFIPVYDAIT